MGHRLLAMVPALALLLASACGDPTPVEQFELSGRVTDALSGDGIGNATVIFVSDTLYRTQTTTGSGGRYEMVVDTDTPFGQARAERDGYVPGEATVFFDAPQRRIDLELRPMGSAEP